MCVCTYHSKPQAITISQHLPVLPVPAAAFLVSLGPFHQRQRRLQRKLRRQGTQLLQGAQDTVEALKGNSIGKGKLGRPNEKLRKTKEQPRKTPGKPRNTQYITEPSNEPIDHQHQSSKYERKAPSAQNRSRRGYQPKKQTNKKKEEWLSNETKTM